MEAETAFDPKFLPSVLALEPSESHRVWKAVDQYTTNPKIRSLRLERLGSDGASRRLWSIRASLDLRVLLARQGSMTIFLRAGHHDHIYEMANRSAYVAPVEGHPRLITVRSETHGTGDPSGSHDLPAVDAHAEGGAKPSAPAEPSVLDHWNDAELAEAGFDERSVGLLRRATLDTLIEVWDDIDEASLDSVVELSELSPEEWRQNQKQAEDGEAHSRFRRAIFERGPVAGLSSVLMPHEVRRLAAAPIEDWMIFLHPEQRSLVERRFSGPARVRGSAGTGKTLVALHRAAALAKRPTAQQLDLKSEHRPEHRPEQRPASQPERRSGRQLELPPQRRPAILFTTFVKTLPPVLGNLYERLPTSVPGAVEFVNIDKLARRVCSEAGRKPEVDPRKVESAFSKAWKAVIEPGSPLHKARLTRRYLREEVTAVMKGRGIDSVDEYSQIKRTGRKVPFSLSMRRQAWELREDWDRRLGEAGVADFPDVLRQARDLARSRAQPTYRTAIVDESQDITLVGLQLILALLGGSPTRAPHADVPPLGGAPAGGPRGWDRPDGLFIVGDAAQKIYPGGYTLAQAGVRIAGNSAVLRLNYRNSRRIISTAVACAGPELADDLEGQYTRGDVRIATTRKGVKPALVRTSSFTEQVEFVAQRIPQLLDTDPQDTPAPARKSTPSPATADTPAPDRKGTPPAATHTLTPARKGTPPTATHTLTAGDIGVCVPTNNRVKEAVAGLRAAGLRCQKLDRFNGLPSPSVKIGTFHRAKGLEFKVVFLLGVSASSFPTPRSAGQSALEHSERRALQVNQLYVAMTRARDALYVLCSDEPSDVVYQALDHFDVLEL